MVRVDLVGPDRPGVRAYVQDAEESAYCVGEKELEGANGVSTVSASLIPDDDATTFRVVWISERLTQGRNARPNTRVSTLG